MAETTLAVILLVSLFNICLQLYNNIINVRQAKADLITLDTCVRFEAARLRALQEVLLKRPARSRPDLLIQDTLKHAQRILTEIHALSLRHGGTAVSPAPTSDASSAVPRRERRNKAILAGAKKPLGRVAWIGGDKARMKELIEVRPSEAGPTNIVEYNRREAPFIVSPWAVMVFVALVAVPIASTLVLIYRLVDTEDKFGEFEEEPTQQEPYRDDLSQESDSSSSSSRSSHRDSARRSRSPSPPRSNGDTDDDLLTSQDDNSVNGQEDSAKGEVQPEDEMSTERESLERTAPNTEECKQASTIRPAIQRNKASALNPNPASWPPQHALKSTDFPSIAHVPDLGKPQRASTSTSSPEPPKTNNPESSIRKSVNTGGDLLDDDVKHELADVEAMQSTDSRLGGDRSDEVEGGEIEDGNTDEDGDEELTNPDPNIGVGDAAVVKAASEATTPVPKEGSTPQPSSRYDDVPDPEVAISDDRVEE